jgi:hypothetical protein
LSKINNKTNNKEGGEIPLWCNMTVDIESFEDKIKNLEDQLAQSQECKKRWLNNWGNELTENKKLQAKIEILKEIIREMITEGKK